MCFLVSLSDLPTLNRNMHYRSETRMSRRWSLPLIPLVLVFYCLSLFAAEVDLPAGFDSVFASAQQAARAARYRDVINLLGGALDDPRLTPGERTIALANRGIAHSLLKSYDLAKKDLTEALALQPAHPLSLNHMGILAEHVDGNFEAAYEWYIKAADGGFAASQVNVARLFEEGLGTAKNQNRARQYLLLAAEQDYTMAYVPLGVHYLESSIGDDQSYQIGLSWIRKAMDQGIVEAAYYLGWAFETGRGVTSDAHQAFTFYQVAAMQGHARSQSALGYLYRRGLGVERDFLQAVKWYRLAADQGEAQAINRLAWLLATCPTQRVCNGESAVQLALEAVAADSGPSNLDSLAAAYARVGKFDLAIATIRKVISLYGEQSGYLQRLQAYQQGIPYQLSVAD